MGRWSDKFERHHKKWETWRMKEYPREERILTHILEDKARTHENRVVFQFRDYPLTFGELNERINKVLITSYRRIGGGDREQLVRDVGHLEPDFMLKGPAADVERIFRAPAGSRVRGTFKHMRGGRQSLLIIPAELTIESPEKARAG